MTTWSRMAEPRKVQDNLYRWKDTGQRTREVTLDPGATADTPVTLEYPGFRAHLVLCDAASPGGSAVMRLPGLEPGPVFV